MPTIVDPELRHLLHELREPLGARARSRFARWAYQGTLPPGRVVGIGAELGSARVRVGATGT